MDQLTGSSDNRFFTPFEDYKNHLHITSTYSFEEWYVTTTEHASLAISPIYSFFTALISRIVSRIDPDMINIDIPLDTTYRLQFHVLILVIELFCFIFPLIIITQSPEAHPHPISNLLIFALLFQPALILADHIFSRPLGTLLGPLLTAVILASRRKHTPAMVLASIAANVHPAAGVLLPPLVAWTFSHANDPPAIAGSRIPAMLTPLLALLAVCGISWAPFYSGDSLLAVLRGLLSSSSNVMTLNLWSILGHIPCVKPLFGRPETLPLVLILSLSLLLLGLVPVIIPVCSGKASRFALYYALSAAGWALAMLFCSSDPLIILIPTALFTLAANAQPVPVILSNLLAALQLLPFCPPTVAVPLIGLALLFVGGVITLWKRQVRFLPASGRATARSRLLTYIFLLVYLPAAVLSVVGRAGGLPVPASWPGLWEWIQHLSGFIFCMTLYIHTTRSAFQHMDNK